MIDVQFNHDARNDWWVFHVVSPCPNNGLAAMALWSRLPKSRSLMALYHYEALKK